jgi:hypothetical protein
MGERSSIEAVLACPISAWLSADVVPTATACARQTKIIIKQEEKK